MKMGTRTLTPGGGATAARASTPVAVQHQSVAASSHTAHPTHCGTWHVQELHHQEHVVWAGGARGRGGGEMPVYGGGGEGGGAVHCSQPKHDFLPHTAGLVPHQTTHSASPWAAHIGGPHARHSGSVHVDDWHQKAQFSSSCDTPLNACATDAAQHRRRVSRRSGMAMRSRLLGYQ